MKLVAKFNLVLLAVFLVGLIGTAVVTHTILQANARQEVADRAGLMMEAALAMRSYTVSEIRPKLAPHMTETFFPQTVPAYAATQAFNKLREHHAEYTYKEATLNPTNPRDRAVAWEADLITTFQNFPDQGEVIGTRATPTGEALYLARPIQIKNPACLSCHSTPDQAPKAMVALYGDSNGFGWKLNEVVGAQIVQVPMSVPVAHANRAFLVFTGALVAVFALLVIILNIMLRRIVISPITRMADAAQLVSKGDFSAPAFEDGGKDEIATLAGSFTRMRRSLEKAIERLRSGRKTQTSPKTGGA